MESKKIFVGGLSYDTCETTLTQHFQKYGEILRSEIMRHKDTGLSRGFGFVTFVDAASFRNAIDDKEHIIHERKVDVQKALREGWVNTHQQLNCGNEIDTKKIFVGGLPSTLSVNEFKGYFEKFGKITDTVIICDKQNNPKGFGFVTFESDESVKNVLNDRYHILKEKQVEVKSATPKEMNYSENYVYDAYNNGYGYYGGSEAMNSFSSYSNYGDMSRWYHEANFYENYGHYYPIDYYPQIIGALAYVRGWNGDLIRINYGYPYNWYEGYGAHGVAVEL